MIQRRQTGIHAAIPHLAHWDHSTPFQVGRLLLSAQRVPGATGDTELDDGKASVLKPFPPPGRQTCHWRSYWGRVDVWGTWKDYVASCVELWWKGGQERSAGPHSTVNHKGHAGEGGLYFIGSWEALTFF